MPLPLLMLTEAAWDSQLSVFGLDRVVRSLTKPSLAMPNSEAIEPMAKSQVI